MPKTRTQLFLNRLMLAAAWMAFAGTGLDSFRVLVAADWPMWRANSARTGYVDKPLQTDLHLQWQRDLPPATPAWPTTQDKLRFDDASNPVVVGQRIFVNSTTIDAVTAYDTRTGEQLWRFYADGPVRFAPAASKRFVYFTSDDGYLYCVHADSGTLEWKKRGGPSKRMNLGNGRMISSWPARGAPVIHDGTVYFAASVWPFMGVFIHALDAETGEPIWSNSGDGMNLTIQPHGAPSFATVVPQGHLLVDDDFLIVPGGRSVPAVYDRRTGELLHFEYVKKHGGHSVMSAGKQYFVSGMAYQIADGTQYDDIHADVYDGEQLIAFHDSQLIGYEVECERIEKTTKDRLGRKKTKVTFERKKKWEQEVRGRIDKILAKSGDTVWCKRGRRLLAFDLSEEDERPSWVREFESEVWDVIIADDRLFVVTKDNRLHCFGTTPSQEPVTHQLANRGNRNRQRGQNGDTPVLPERIATDQIATDFHKSAGYALVLGIESGQLVHALLNQTDMHVVILPSRGDTNREQNFVSSFREDLIDDGHYGRRVAILPDDISPESLPKYFASLICSEMQKLTANHITRFYESLRPFGGKFYVPTDNDRAAKLRSALERNGDPQARFESDGNLAVITREGPLPNTDDWTHQYANAAQTGISQESVVKSPLGVLWFGGISHEGILPRHGHGPSPQVAGGRLVIEGPDLLRAIDIYTGNQLWEKSLPGLGEFYDNTKHMPGAGEIGSNYVTLADRVFVVYGERLLELDAKNGKTIREFGTSDSTGRNVSAHWGYLGISDNYLIATSAPVTIVKADKDAKLLEEKPVIPKSAEWKYWASKEDPADDWSSISFDDQNWSEGTAGFGYGDEDDTTILSNMKGRFARVYLRQTFDAEQLTGARKLTLYNKFDDGFVAYLNGQEICRSHVKGKGPSAEVESHEADDYDSFEIEDWSKHVVPGPNVIAIEAHNRGKSSSDFSIDPYLMFVPKADPSDAAAADVKLEELLEPTRFSSGSLRINVFDRSSGKLLWYRDAVYNFRHNSICASNGKLFCVDMLSIEKRRALERRGLSIQGDAKLYGIDLQTGEVEWEQADRVFGTFLNYSEEHDILIQGGSLNRDRAYDEVGKGIVAYRGSTGRELWANLDLIYNGPVLLWKDRIITNGKGGFALDMLTGQKTGWEYEREYGCNTAIGCQNFLTFRSGAAGFYDLLSDSGTSNLGGFRSSCTNNLIPAGGILNAPDYTRTCSCSYQNQTSLALVYMPEAETWSFGSTETSSGLAVNFGAPGDRRDSHGRLWVDFPSVGGKSPTPDIQTQPPTDELEVFRLHSGLVTGETPWITASGVTGIREISLNVESNDEKTVRIYFCEPNRLKSGQRTFEITANEKSFDARFDVTSVAGQPRHGIIKEFDVMPDSKVIRIRFTPTESAKTAGFEPIVSGIEVLDKN